jgi:hypothetical protein
VADRARTRVGEGCANTPRRNDGRSTVADGRPAAVHLHREELGGRAVVYPPQAAADRTSVRRCADGLLARREESRRGAQRNDQKHGKERQDRAARAECGPCQLHDAHHSGDNATKTGAKSPCSPKMGARGWAVASNWHTPWRCRFRQPPHVGSEPAPEPPDRRSGSKIRIERTTRWPEESDRLRRRMRRRPVEAPYPAAHACG